MILNNCKIKMPLTSRKMYSAVNLWIQFFSCQVLIATATVAWGVNFPAHLVVVKGTEFYDGKQKRYVDMPITDVLQMIGRAGNVFSLNLDQ